MNKVDIVIQKDNIKNSIILKNKEMDIKNIKKTKEVIEIYSSEEEDSRYEECMKRLHNNVYLRYMKQFAPIKDDYKFII